MHQSSPEASTSRDFNVGEIDALSFLKVHPSKWEKLPQYLSVKHHVLNLTVINDVAERGLALITEFNNSKVPKSEQQKQFLFKVMKEMRAIQNKTATGSERITKGSLSQTNYEWN